MVIFSVERKLYSEPLLSKTGFKQAFSPAIPLILHEAVSNPPMLPLVPAICRPRRRGAFGVAGTSGLTAIQPSRNHSRVVLPPKAGSQPLKMLSKTGFHEICFGQE